MLLGSHKYSLYKPHKLPWALSQILLIISHILPNLGSHTNTYHTITKIGSQNYTISIKSPNSFTLWAKSKKPNKTLFTKSIATWHPKARCYTTPLKPVATWQYFFYKISNYLQKPKYYFGNYLQKPNIILAITYKSPILSWQLFTKAQILFGKIITLCSKPKTIP